MKRIFAGLFGLAFFGLLAIGGLAQAETAPDGPPENGWQYSEFLPDLTNEASHALTAKFIGPANPASKPAKAVDEVVSLEDGNVMGIWHQKLMYPYTSLCFFWDGEKMGCVDAPDLSGGLTQPRVGWFYDVELTIGASQQWKVNVSNIERHLMWYGPRIGWTPMMPYYHGIPHNDGCPCDQWAKTQGEALECLCPVGDFVHFGWFKCRDGSGDWCSVRGERVVVEPEE